MAQTLGQQVPGIDPPLVAPEAARTKQMVKVQPPLRRLSDERQEALVPSSQLRLLAVALQRGGARVDNGRLSVVL